MISIPQLEYIVAVDTYRHFVTAASKCFVTQPTLSMQIKKLEEDLGVVIFDRSKHPIEPTILGQKIIAQARIILSETSVIDEIIQSSKNHVSGELHIGIIPTIAPYLLPLFIGDFIKAFPNVQLKVQELMTDEMVERLENGAIDIGIAVTPVQVKGIKEWPLYYEPMVLYTNIHHAYHTHAVVDTKVLDTTDIWLLKAGHCFRSQVLNLCDRSIVNSSHHSFEYESGSLETLMRFVEKEGGYTLLPQLAADQQKDHSFANIIPFSSPQPLREVSLIYSRLYTKKRLLELVAQYIQKAVPPYMLQANNGQVVEWR